MRYQNLTDDTRKIYLEEYFNWDVQIAHAKSDELSSFESAQVISSFSYLRDLLGETFPQTCFENDNTINRYFINKAPWTRIWFNWLANAIRTINPQSSQVILNKLTSHRDEDFAEACSLLEVGLKVAKAGFVLQYENTVVNDKGKSKKPDITITNQETKEEVLIEVTRLTKNPATIKYQLLFEKVYFGGLDHQVRMDFGGSLFKDLSDEHLEELNREIDAKLRTCLSTKTFQEVNHQGIIELAFAPAGNDIFAEWSKLKGYDTNSFSFPETNILGRIKSKIIHKKDQLSSNHPCLLVIKNEDFSLNAKNYEYVKDGLLETIHRCPEILAVVLITSEMSNVEKTVSNLGFAFYVERTERHLFTTKTVMLFNRFCKTKITPHTLMRLFEAFEKH